MQQQLCLYLSWPPRQHSTNRVYLGYLVKVAKQAQRVQQMSLLRVASCKVLQKMVSENACNINCGCTRLGHLSNIARIESIWVISQGSQASRESTENVVVTGCFMQSFAENGQ